MSTTFLSAGGEIFENIQKHFKRGSFSWSYVYDYLSLVLLVEIQAKSNSQHEIMKYTCQFFLTDFDFYLTVGGMIFEVKIKENLYTDSLHCTPLEYSVLISFDQGQITFHDSRAINFDILYQNFHKKYGRPFSISELPEQLGNLVLTVKGD